MEFEGHPVGTVCSRPSGVARVYKVGGDKLGAEGANTVG